MWALPTPGGAGEFPRLVEVLTRTDPSKSSSRASRGLFAVRSKLGELLGWDEPDSRAPTLRDRLPADLSSAEVPATGALPFSTVYLTADEWALELANRTVHGVLHLGWVEDQRGHRGEMAIYVKRNGLLGTAYMAAIRPFRHRFVYPALLRDIGRRWRDFEAAGELQA